MGDEEVGWRMTRTTLGISNNNAGNIRVSKSKWKGEIPSSGPFEKFDSPVMGIRALMRLLLNYQRRYKLNTIRNLINRWAPHVENDTAAYVDHVSQVSGFEPDTVIDLTCAETLIEIAQAIVLHENGHPPAGSPKYWYDDTVYEAAASMALAY